MTHTKRILVVAGALVVVLAVGLAAAARVAQVAQPAPYCGGQSQPLTAPPAQLVTAADYFTLGDSEFEAGNCNGAVDAYSQVIALDPQLATAYNNRAYTYMAQHNYAAALPDLDRALALRPDYVNALMNRGDIYNYYYHIDYDKAIADYDRVLALDHQHTSVCGHRLLAQHHGWDLAVLATVVMQRGAAGCS
jgi:tetratricopeptide (TPR) repeat protein